MYASSATISKHCRATGIHSRTLTILRHSFLSRALRATLRANCRARSTRVVSISTVMPPRPVCGVADGALGIATPSGDLAAFDMPGPRTIASTMRVSSSSSPGISSTIVPRDITNTRSHSPESSIGSLDLTSSAAPCGGTRAERLVDVDAGADVDTLGRFVGQDHRRFPQERTGDRDLLLVAAGQELDRLVEPRGADLELLDELLAQRLARSAGAARRAC